MSTLYFFVALPKHRTTNPSKNVLGPQTHKHHAYPSRRIFPLPVTLRDTAIPTRNPSAPLAVRHHNKSDTENICTCTSHPKHEYHFIRYSQAD